MKLIVVVGPSSFDKEIKSIFEKSEINKYSRTDISGHSENEESDISRNWFAISNEYQKSIIFFSFTKEDKAKKVLEASKSFNDSITSKSRIRAFIMPVENHI